MTVMCISDYNYRNWIIIHETGNKKFVNAHNAIQIYHNKNFRQMYKTMHQYGIIKQVAV